MTRLHATRTRPHATQTAARRALVAALLVAVIPVRGAAQARASREDVTFRSDGLTLAGTIHWPDQPGPRAGVVLVHGSGRTTRDDLGYFAQLFARAGVAALVWDKRGVGRSEGPSDAWRRFNLDDLAADAVAAARFLRTRPGIDPARVGLFAVSQGGWIAPVAAARLGDVRFVVTVSASLTTIADDNLFERSARLRREGFGESDVAAARAMHLVDNDVSRGHGGFEQFVRLWEEHKGSRWFRRVYGDPQPSPPDSPYRAWYRTVMDRDPVADWARLTAPALFIFGDPALDEFSPVAQSVARVDSLAAAGRPFERLIVAGADHNLRRNGADVDLATPLSAWLARALAAP